ncbi:hypothetical protein [Pacificibacter maritimus]|uniref:hypothetical protein n=1 Tax=Pacificibacter maritimus TaxID=762213 RepID=UPI001473F785|nr:hypothetical protein [Pacificibacter maritimus]
MLDTEFRALLRLHNPYNDHCRHAENAYQLLTYFRAVGLNSKRFENFFANFGWIWWYRAAIARISAVTAQKGTPICH